MHKWKIFLKHGNMSIWLTNTFGGWQWINPHYDGAQDAEDNDLLSSVPNNSYDRPRAQLEAYMD